MVPASHVLIMASVAMCPLQATIAKLRKLVIELVLATDMKQVPTIHAMPTHDSASLRCDAHGMHVEHMRPIALLVRDLLSTPQHFALVGQFTALHRLTDLPTDLVSGAGSSETLVRTQTTSPSLEGQGSGTSKADKVSQSQLVSGPSQNSSNTSQAQVMLQTQRTEEEVYIPVSDSDKILSLQVGRGATHTRIYTHTTVCETATMFAGRHSW